MCIRDRQGGGKEHGSASLPRPGQAKDVKGPALGRQGQGEQALPGHQGLIALAKGTPGQAGTQGAKAQSHGVAAGGQGVQEHLRPPRPAEGGGLGTCLLYTSRCV